ncbi:MAG: hypothetical protein ACD_46C00223G0003 [uncultured bacterium]|nr:MAG: hypothetical protein ACD_46C00223G0003 [uncultured bacterium]
MKIKIVDSSTKKPLVNTKVPLQIKGKDSGFLSLTTDATGSVDLDGKYNGQQIMSPAGGGQSNWTTVTDGMTLTVASKQKTTEPSSQK